MLYIHGMAPGKGITVHLKRHRQAAELTQQELADRVGVTRQTIISIERGRYRPSIELALQLAQVFALPVESLFSLAEGAHDEHLD